MAGRRTTLRKALKLARMLAELDAAARENQPVRARRTHRVSLGATR
jgi:hypothetical protein